MVQQISNNFDKFNSSFFTLLKNRCFESGNDLAFIFKNKQYTWNDVDISSDLIASELKALGVKKGSHVGLCGINSMNWIFTFFAIQKLGGIVVLINPKLNPNEVVSVSEIGDVEYLCYSEIEGITSFDAYKKECLVSKKIKNVFNFSENIDFLTRSKQSLLKDFKDELKPDDACIIIYTSGSTGKPKAVLSSAYGILFSIKPIIDDIKHCKDDISLGFLPFFHVFGFITTIVLGLLQGFVSVIPTTNKPNELISLIDKYKVSLFNTVPTMMLAMVANKEFSPNKLASLRQTTLGGSSTSKEQMIMLKRLIPNNHFANIYGMSENSTISLTKYDDTFEHITETVGKPLEGNNVLIKDNNGKTLKQGEIGEICVKSGGMLVWYYKVPIENQPIDNDGYLKTGDLGYLDKDGYIRLTGRIKDLIISGGENISPNEIGDALRSLNHFEDVKVVGLPDEIKGEVVAAALILKEGYIFNEKELKEELSKLLAKYKIPVYYQIFTSFPILATGKIDKNSIIEEMKKFRG